MKKRMLITVMVILLICSAVLTLFSCDDGIKEPDDDIVVTRPTPNEYDLEGYTIKFAVCEGNNEESLVGRSICPDENSGDSVDKAIIMRNKSIENRYNCNIEMSYYIANKNISLTPKILSGSGDYDVLVGRQCDDISLCLNGALVDVVHHEDAAPYIDLEVDYPLVPDYWGYNYTYNISSNGNVYWLVGDISMNFTGGLYCTFVNLAIYDDEFKKTEGSIYDLVRNREWTVDKVKMLADAATTKKNITFDELIVSEEYIGIAMPVNETMDALAIAAGAKFCEIDQSGKAVCTANQNNAALRGFFDKYYEILGSGSAINTGSDYKSAFAALARDNALMTFGYLHQANTYLQNMTTPFYVLPMPMLNENQANYYTPVVKDIALVGISSSSKNIKASAIVLDAMCKESYRSVRPYYYEKRLNFKYTTDLDFAEMMDLLVNTAYTDPVYAWSNTEYFDGVGEMIKNAFSSCSDAESAIKTFPVSEKIWNDNLQTIMEKLSGKNN